MTQVNGVDFARMMPSEDFIGKVGGNTRVKTGIIIRPADTTAYAVGDLIGASTTAGVSNVMTVPDVTRVPGGTGRIIRARVATNQPAFGGTIRLHLFKTLVAPTVGDNAPLAATVPNYVNAYGPTEVTLGQGIFSDGSKGYMAFSPPVAFDVPDGQSDVYVILEARTVFTPTPGQRFSVTLECDVD